jgi:lipopolysaccharide transport system permease protein
MATKKSTATNWDLVIRPERAWWDFRLDELWRYRDLVLLLVRRNYVASYKQTILGPFWHFINPVITSLLFTFIFGRLAGLPTDELPPFLFYFSGNVVWTYFSHSLTGTSNIFVSNQRLFGKVYFPRLIMPISVVISNLVQFGIRFLLFGVILLYFLVDGYPIEPNSWALLTPGLVVLMAGLGLSWGIIVSSLTTKYRDLQILVNFGVRFLLYITPVIYPASMVPANLQGLYFLNPIAPIVEAFRYGFLGEGTVDTIKLLYSAGFMVVSLVIGIALFNRVEQNFMDTV